MIEKGGEPCHFCADRTATDTDALTLYSAFNASPDTAMLQAEQVPCVHADRPVMTHKAPLPVGRDGRVHGYESGALDRQAQPDAVWSLPTRVELCGSCASIDVVRGAHSTLCFTKCSLVLRARIRIRPEFRTLHRMERAEFEVAMRGMAHVKRTPYKTRRRARCAKVKVFPMGRWHLETNVTSWLR